MNNIVVCVKYVPDSAEERKFENDNTVDRRRRSSRHSPVKLPAAWS